MKLTESQEQAYRALASRQRDVPERAMLRVQFANGGGVLNPVVEDTGDLIHRMSEDAGWIQGAAGYGAVKEKVERILRRLEHPYGFRRERMENLEHNADYDHEPPARRYVRVREALRAYAQAHAALPVYTRAQELAREAAVAVGEERFEDARAAVLELQQHLGTREEWMRFAWFSEPMGGARKNPRGRVAVRRRAAPRPNPAALPHWLRDPERLVPAAQAMARGYGPAMHAFYRDNARAFPALARRLADMPEIPVWRAIIVPGKGDPVAAVDFRRLGRAWGLTRRAAVAYNYYATPEAAAGSTVIVVLAGLVGPEAVDWRTTFVKHVHQPEEEEIVLLSHAPVRVVGAEVVTYEPYRGGRSPMPGPPKVEQVPLDRTGSVGDQRHDLWIKEGETEAPRPNPKRRAGRNPTRRPRRTR
jgi:hypothetical protein